MEKNKNQEYIKNEIIEEVQEKQGKGVSRRGLAGLIGGALIAAAVGGTKSAHAEGASDAQTAANTGFMLQELKDIVTKADKWVGKWNDYVHNINDSISFAKSAYTMITEPQKNIFYLQLKQMIDYVDTQLTKKGNFLDYRIDYFYPVLLEKVHSMMNQVSNLNYRWKNLALKDYLKLNPDSTEEEYYALQGINYHDSNIGKTIRRTSVDTANYSITRAKIEAFQNISKEAKKSINNMELEVGDPKNGMAPQKSRGQIFAELTSPVHVDVQIEMLRTLNEISMKMTNLILVNSKIGEPPITGENEHVMTPDEVVTIIKDMLQDSPANSDPEKVILEKKKKVKKE